MHLQMSLSENVDLLIRASRLMAWDVKLEHLLDKLSGRMIFDLR